jgi:hypothetical protein
LGKSDLKDTGKGLISEKENNAELEARLRELERALKETDDALKRQLLENARKDLQIRQLSRNFMNRVANKIKRMREK